MFKRQQNAQFRFKKEKEKEAMLYDDLYKL